MIGPRKLYELHIKSFNSAYGAYNFIPYWALAEEDLEYWAALALSIDKEKVDDR